MHDMGRKKRTERGGFGRAAILAAFWTLIGVTLLSALAPLGPPLSQSRGSAFNPATAEVVLKSRATMAVQMVQPARPDGDDAPAVLMLCLAMALFIGIWRMLPVMPLSRATYGLSRLHLARAHRARAPPAFS